MRRTFNFPKDVDKHLARQDNMTQYLVRLIRQDMNDQDIVTKQDVIKVIEDYLKTTKTDIISTQSELFLKEPKKLDEISNSINNIINM